MERRSIVVGISIVILLAGGVWIYKRKLNPGPPAPSASSEAKVKVRGPESARITIVEYSDFQCPACKNSEPDLKALMEKYPGDVKLIFMHFPLPGHLWSSVAHPAAECANRQGKFWEYHDKLFGTQQEWSGPAHPLEKFLTFAKDLGLNLDAFAACLSDEAVKRSVNADRAHGDSLQVTSTPTFFINGERLVGPQEFKIKGEAVVRRQLGLSPLPSPPPQTVSTTPSSGLPAKHG